MDRGLVSNSLKNEYSMFYKVSGCLHPVFSNSVPESRKYAVFSPGSVPGCLYRNSINAI